MTETRSNSGYTPLSEVACRAPILRGGYIGWLHSIGGIPAGWSILTGIPVVGRAGLEPATQGL